MLKRRTKRSSSRDPSVQFQSQMEHACPCPDWLGNGRISFRSLLVANHLGYGFQSRNIQELASGSLGMTAEHLFLVRRGTLPGIASFENVVGKRDTTNQTQRRGYFVLPGIVETKFPVNPENNVTDRPGSHG